MRRATLLVSGGILSFIAAFVLAFDDHMSELSPLFSSDPSVVLAGSFSKGPNGSR